MDTGGFRILAAVNNAAMNIWGNRYIFKTVISFPSNTYLEVELLDHMLVLFSIFWGTFILFSIGAILAGWILMGSQWYNAQKS